MRRSKTCNTRDIQHAKHTNNKPNDATTLKQQHLQQNHNTARHATKETLQHAKNKTTTTTNQHVQTSAIRKQRYRQENIHAITHT